MAFSNKDDFQFEVVKDLGEFGEGKWATHVALVSWNGKPAKLDIRAWNEDMTRMGKGITLSHNDAFNLVDILQKYLDSPEGSAAMAKEGSD